MTAREIYEAIAARELYEFKAKDPFGIVRNTLSKKSVENTHSCASKEKLFTRVDKARFALITVGK